MGEGGKLAKGEGDAGGGGHGRGGKVRGSREGKREKGYT